MAINTDWYTFKEYGKPLTAIAHPKDRALKVVFMAAEPREIEGQVRYEEQERTILEAIQRRPIDINVEESGCLEELQLTLDEYGSDLDILHLVGIYETEDEQGYLITEDEYGNRVNSTAEDICRAIKKASPRLVILCSSYRYRYRGYREGVAIIAEKLIEKGSEAVITLEGDRSETLMTTIYRQLASGNTLEDALREIHRQPKQTLTDFFLGVHLANRQLISHPLVRTGLKFTPTPTTVRVLDGVGKFKEMTRANFIGRRRQLQNCLYALRNVSEYVGVILHGGGGLGKSSIASRLSFGRLSNYEMIFWSDWKKGVTPLSSKALIDKLKKTNSIFREPALLSYLNELTEETLETNLKILFDELNQKEKPLLLIFDDFEWNLEPQEDGTYTIRTEPERILQAVIEAVLNTNHKIIITCRYDKFDRDSCILPYFYPQGLEPLPESDLEKLFRRLENFNSHRIEEKLQEKAKEVAAGNPRLLEELNTVLGKSSAAAKRELDAYEKDPNKKESIIWRELYHQIKKDEELETVLGYGLVYRIPVPKNTLVEVCGEKEEQIEKGINLGLIEESSEREEENRLYRVSPILPKTISGIHLPVDEQELLSLYGKAHNLLDSLWGNRENGNEERWEEIFRLAFADKENPERFREQFSKMLSVQYNRQADLAYENELRREREYLAANQGQIYQRLEEYLEQQDWKNADYETAFIMYQWMVIENYADFYALFEQVSLDVVDEIDRLWMDYSKGKFGIKGQAKIYEGRGGTNVYDHKIWASFCDCVGWCEGGQWLNYEDVTFGTTANDFHLPIAIYCKPIKDWMFNLRFVGIGREFSKAWGASFLASRLKGL